MTRINLLPWRELRRADQQRRFLMTLAASVVLAALGVLGAHLYVVDLTEYQEERNQFILSLIHI